MTLADLDRVCQIDELSFSLPWPRRSFYYEVADNKFSTCWVAEIAPELAPGTPSPGKPSLWVSALQAIQGRRQDHIVGMAVVWLVVDEAHIATIAVHPEFRGLGIGKQMMVVILEDSRQRGMATATLEVRASNQVAQKMYQDFGFEVVGVRQHYYKDNQEDALIMTANLAKTHVV